MTPQVAPTSVGGLERDDDVRPAANLRDMGTGLRTVGHVVEYLESQIAASPPVDGP